MATIEPAYDFYGHGPYAYPPCAYPRPLIQLDGRSPGRQRSVGAQGSFRATRGAASGGESVVGLASMPSSSSIVSPTNGRPHVSTNGNNTNNGSHHHSSLPSLASSNTELASSFAATPVSNHSISPTTSQQTPVIPHNIIPDRRPMSRHDSGEGTSFSLSLFFSSARSSLMAPGLLQAAQVLIGSAASMSLRQAPAIRTREATWTMSRCMSTRASTTASSSGVQREHGRQKCADCPRSERYVHRSHPAFPISLPLSLARFLSSVSLDHISGIRRHINNHLNLLLNSLTHSSFPLPHPLPSFLAFNTFFAFSRNHQQPYLHQSRHNHAVRRPRGPGGRFLTAEEIATRKSQAQAQEDTGPSEPSAGPGEGPSTVAALTESPIDDLVGPHEETKQEKSDGRPATASSLQSEAVSTITGASASAGTQSDGQPSSEGTPTGEEYTTNPSYTAVGLGSLTAYGYE